MEIVAALGPVTEGETRELKLSGELLDGTQFEGSDCVTIVGNPDHVIFTETEVVGGEVTLMPALPNPFNPVTRIGYLLPKTATVRLTVFDVQGKLVERLVAGTQPAGEHVVEWDATGRVSGIYFYRLVAGDYTETRKMILLK
jgi:hypothetical protein